MTPAELQKILQSDEKLTVKQVKEIIWRLKEDCYKEIYKLKEEQKAINIEECGMDGKMDFSFTSYFSEKFYNGETNAFYICLDLLSKIDDTKETPVKVEWEEQGVRVCPNCKHKSCYCVGVSNESHPKQPDNYCSKCGQRFIKE